MSYQEDDNNYTAGKSRRGDTSDKAHLLAAAKRCLHLADQLDHSIRRCVVLGSPPPKMET
jgi:hypothetical protein